MMNKETMISDMTAKVTEVLDAREAVETFLESIEDIVADGKRKVVELQEELQTHQEALTMAEDIGQAKLIKQQIDNAQEDIELQVAVNEAKAKSMYGALENKVETFFKAHRSAVFMYQAVDGYFLVNTGLAELIETKELLNKSFANPLNNSFRAVSNILLDTGIVSNADQNKTYRGTHLGKRVIVSELDSFEIKVRPYLYELRQAGKLSN